MPSVRIPVKRILTRIVASVLCPFSDVTSFADDDIDASATSAYQPMITQGTEAIVLVVRGAVESALGAFVSDLNETEGVDPDIVDQVLGVLPEDL